ncbi:MAG TPA: 4-phosphoerythronate dehydrogenase [Acidobacteriota bacterium]|nr:4-phosphoerythronate dehydrogenase [Acidobacteriota bacterium]
MIIALDQSIPCREKAFSEFGAIRPFPGRDLKPEAIRDADALIVRTITRVNAPLLEGSSIRFVASASAGFDHVDRDYLKERGIHFYHAAGCNAGAVSEYIMTALYRIAGRRGWDLKRLSLAVIGVGNVGSLVAKKAGAIGMEVLLCDPPLRDLTGDPRYIPWESALEADILTFHVPLVSSGPYPTRHMVDRSLLGRLRPDQFIINSARGEVIDGRQLKTALIEKRIAGAVLDVWEGEPHYDRSLLELIDIGTPHIAGVTLDAKIKAVDMVREELGRFCGRTPLASLYRRLFSGEKKILRPEGLTARTDTVNSILQQAYDIETDNGALRSANLLPIDQAAAAFDRLRDHHPLRPEFPNFRVCLSRQHENAAAALAGLGFSLVS